MRRTWAAALAGLLLALTVGCEPAPPETRAGATPTPAGPPRKADAAPPPTPDPGTPRPPVAPPDDGPVGPPVEPGKAAEPLPEAPKLDPRNAHVALNREKTFFAEQTPDRKFVRVLLAAEVCMREGPLEVFLCRKQTKEHESVLRVDLDAKLIHAALVAAGGRPGGPAQFLTADTGKAEYKPAHGSKVRVLVHYRKDGKLHTHPAQEWIRDQTTMRPVAYDWVFAGSVELKDPDRPDAPPYYGANSGEVISVSNFPYSMLDFPVEIGRENAGLTLHARTDKIPPLLSGAWVILEPVPGP